jgi:hypothetical protein
MWLVSAWGWGLSIVQHGGPPMAAISRPIEDVAEQFQPRGLIVK